MSGGLFFSMPLEISLAARLRRLDGVADTGFREGLETEGWAIEPARDWRGCLDIIVFVAGGPIEGRLAALSRDLTLESDVRAVVVGVLVLGVEAAELEIEEGRFVGDLVGDWHALAELSAS